MSKHTSGPWIVKPDRERKSCTICVGAAHVCLARLTRAFSIWETRANACLIAAAPDMFEVCELIIESELEEDDSRSYDLLIEATAKARVVMEKVRGGNEHWS
jgi:hypothetical protein